MLLREAGIALPSWDDDPDAGAASCRARCRAFERHLNNFSSVAAGQERVFDLAGFFLGSALWHVGVLVELPSTILHIEDDSGASATTGVCGLIYAVSSEGIGVPVPELRRAGKTSLTLPVRAMPMLPAVLEYARSALFPTVWLRTNVGQAAFPRSALWNGRLRLSVIWRMCRVCCAAAARFGSMG